MDISVFSKCLKDLLLRNDEIVVPGLGVFTAQIVADEVNEDGTARTPYRKILYSPVQKPEDGMFLRWLAKYLPEGSDAESELQEFLLDLSGELEDNRAVELGDLGQLHSSAHKIYYFVSNTDVFEYPDVPGQESIGALLPEEFAEEDSKPIELDTEKWIKQDDNTNTVAAEQPADKPAHVPQPVQNEEEVADEDEEPAPSRLSILIGNILLILFVVIIFLMIAVALLKDLPWMSNLLDHLLYTKEELQILGK
ncbi:MAG: hypothetical protein IKN31_02650 [Bacteroidales bacterium]|nr:hypothetical protein [Bacteroidales bacterium]